jgi:ubiquinone/menaquinone biosynthesis C-methylase UbiE
MEHSTSPLKKLVYQHEKYNKKGWLYADRALISSLKINGFLPNRAFKISPRIFRTSHTLFLLYLSYRGNQQLEGRSQMRLYSEKVLPKLIDIVMSGELFSKERARVVPQIQGQVLEIGFGSGLNLPYYPKTVTGLYALDPSLEARKLAAKRLAKVPFPVKFIGLHGEEIPLEDESVDTVLSTWTLCTIPGIEQALAEIRRVLKKATGRFIFLEHGLSPEVSVARWQHRLTPLQKKIGGGCHLDRPIAELIKSAGFSLESLDEGYVKGPRVATYFYRGVARPLLH